MLKTPIRQQNATQTPGAKKNCSALIEIKLNNK
jgi:hypothetical protein